MEEFAFPTKSRFPSDFERDSLDAQHSWIVWYLFGFRTQFLIIFRVSGDSVRLYSGLEIRQSFLFLSSFRVCECAKCSFALCMSSVLLLTLIEFQIPLIIVTNMRLWTVWQARSESETITHIRQQQKTEQLFSVQKRFPSSSHLDSFRICTHTSMSDEFNTHTHTHIKYYTSFLRLRHSSSGDVAVLSQFFVFVWYTNVNNIYAHRASEQCSKEW